MKKILTHFAAFLIVFALCGTAVVFAQPQGGATGVPQGGATGSSNNVPIKFDNPFKVGGTLHEFLEVMVNDIVLPVGGMICVLMFIWTGFMYVKAQGKPGEIETANRSLLYTSIGTALLLGAWVIQNVIYNTVNQLT